MMAGGRNRVGMEGRRRRGGGMTDLLGLFLFVTFFYGAEHPLCHGLVADAEFKSGVQDGGSEDGV